MPPAERFQLITPLRHQFQCGQLKSLFVIPFILQPVRGTWRRFGGALAIGVGDKEYVNIAQSLFI